MTGTTDNRWEQRFSSYRKALAKLTEAIEFIRNLPGEPGDVLGHIIKDGLIHRFEYTYEMAWNVMKDYALYQGNSEIAGSRDAIRYAFASQLIANGDVWMEMITSRIKTSHTYQEETTKEIYQKILNDYHPEFLRFQELMDRCVLVRQA
ncbi:MAG: nucleotidyltransferase substrate binding protein [Bacteroidales bacterium]